MKLSCERFRLNAMCLLLLVAGMTMAGASVKAQNAPIAPSSVQGQGAKPTWTTEQLITATVHDAWLLSGKDEATFFEMVATLADISAKNRGITLPDTKEAGEKMGEYIKTTAKADTDQLLYAVVDKAVMMTAHKGPTPAGSRAKVK
ncbi:MAG TPA: hypothetical protein VM578_07935 [Candidatus Saccharimonadales bacterium]|nr:hypothetical protein [Candidatus Saccharimonadales bacterium]